MNKQNNPKHIALILDGNRRWAKEKGLKSLIGHQRGSENIERLLYKARDLGIECFTAWAFSTENWKRSEAELNYLFDIFRDLFDKNLEKFLKEGAKFKHIGRKDRLPKDIIEKMDEIEERTKDNGGLTIVLALDYGGHDELTRAFEKINKKGLEITEKNIEKSLDTADLPQIDLIIRTGGDLRLSGFMSWQSAYAELYFTDTYFPDFTPEELEKAINEFGNRERRFGGNSKK